MSLVVAIYDLGQINVNRTTKLKIDRKSATKARRRRQIVAKTALTSVAPEDSWAGAGYGDGS